MKFCAATQIIAKNAPAAQYIIIGSTFLKGRVRNYSNNSYLLFVRTERSKRIRLRVCGDRANGYPYRWRDAVDRRETEGFIFFTEQSLSLAPADAFARQLPLHKGAYNNVIAAQA